MFGTHTELISALRSMVFSGSKPSELLRMIISHHESDAMNGMVDRNLLVQYVSEAFCFSDGEAYPIFGWLPDGTGEVKDSTLDYLLSKRIEKTKEDWKAAGSFPSQTAASRRQRKASFCL